jgi:hypothetical protein
MRIYSTRDTSWESVTGSGAMLMRHDIGDEAGAGLRHLELLARMTAFEVERGEKTFVHRRAGCF